MVAASNSAWSCHALITELSATYCVRPRYLPTLGLLLVDVYIKSWLLGLDPSCRNARTTQFPATLQLLVRNIICPNCSGSMASSSAASTVSVEEMSGWTVAMCKARDKLRLRKEDGSCMDCAGRKMVPIQVCVRITAAGDKISAWLQGSFPPRQSAFGLSDPLQPHKRPTLLHSKSSEL